MSALASTVVRRAWKEYADVRRRFSRAGSARPVLDLVDAARRDTAAWNSATAAAHDRYRATCPVATGDVAVVCATNRPGRLRDVVANVARQELVPREVVVVTNGDRSGAALDRAALDARLDELRAVVERVELRTMGADASLGACLNAGLDATTSRFVAKFDDDDRYGPRYLSDALRAHGHAGAGIVGKHTWYAHLVERDVTILRFPGNEFTYTSTLAGATLVIDRERVGDLAFRELSIGEDRAFIADCNRRGVATYAADRFNFVVGRTAEHSWAMSDDAFTRLSITIGAGVPLDEIDR
ncbi:glycosyltransferase [Ilumatobacter sp.]|uniref:glycosyltransferase n=1 Tax=Ilumatobacter sp. TaxID=1967498 RepID=UPI003B5269C3